MSNLPPSQQIPAMKTGFGDDLTSGHKALLLSLLGVYTEEVLKTALLYAVHHGRGDVTPDDMKLAMKYQILSENGCGRG